jgi:hypothetical protein
VADGVVETDVGAAGLTSDVAGETLYTNTNTTFLSSNKALNTINRFTGDDCWSNGGADRLVQRTLKDSAGPSGCKNGVSE